VRRLKLALAGVALALASMAGAASVDAPIEQYRDAAALHDVGVVRGRAYHERRRPSLPDTPLRGVAIALLPRSETWLLRLNVIKRGARDSMDAFRQAAPSVRKAREAYEQALLEAGAGDLPLGATVDADGGFTLEAVPAGPWVLLAYYQIYVSKTPQDRPIPPGQVRPPALPMPFQAPDRFAGFYTVTFWLRELTVSGGTAETVTLTDRNAWFTGVSESIFPPRRPDTPYQPRR
jgi:hypothetical protein